MGAGTGKDRKRETDSPGQAGEAGKVTEHEEAAGARTDGGRATAWSATADTASGVEAEPEAGGDTAPEGGSEPAEGVWDPPASVSGSDLSGEGRAVCVGAGDRHSLVVAADGSVFAFGQGRGGRLGLGDHQDQCRPKQVPAQVLAQSIGLPRFPMPLSHHTRTRTSAGPSSCPRKCSTKYSFA